MQFRNLAHNMIIYFIPADQLGGELILKNYRKEGDKHFIEYKTIHDNLPFREIEIFLIEEEGIFAIIRDDGRILHAFSKLWISEERNQQKGVGNEDSEDIL